MARPPSISAATGVPAVNDDLVPGTRSADGGPPAPDRAARGRRQSPLLRLRGELDARSRVALGLGGVVAFLAAWQLAALAVAGDSIVLPTIGQTLSALRELSASGELWTDLAASLRRVGIAYTISLALGVVFGIAMGSLASAEAWLEPVFAMMRYIPASALTPVLLIWLGIDEAPKITLIVVGTVFYNILMIADVARSVPTPLINASYTLGAGRLTVLRRVVLPHSWPGIIDVARINLAAGWLMLVVAELLAADDGLAARIIRAQRFRRVDRMFALLLVFGLIGIASDLALRALKNRTSPWARA